MKIKNLFYLFLIFFVTQKSTIEEKNFSLLKRAAITSFISGSAFITTKLLKFQKLQKFQKFSSPLKYVSIGLPAAYTCSDLCYRYTPTEFLNNIFKLTNKLYLDELFFLSSPAQILAKKIDSITVQDLNKTNSQLLSKALFYLPKEKQINTIIKLTEKNLINNIASIRTDLGNQIITEIKEEEQEEEQTKLKNFILNFDYNTFKEIAKSNPTEFNYNDHIKKIFNLKLFERNDTQINFLEEIGFFEEKNSTIVDRQSFVQDYIKDVTRDILSLMKASQIQNIFSWLKNNSRLHEIKSLLEDDNITPIVKKSILFDIKKYLESNDVSDEDKTKLEESLKDIDTLPLWKSIYQNDNKEKEENFEKIDIFKIITKFINKNNEETIKAIFEEEIKKYKDGKTTITVIALLFLENPNIANQMLKIFNSNNLLLESYILILNLYKDQQPIENHRYNNVLPIINDLLLPIKDRFHEQVLLLNIKEIFNKIDIQEQDKTKNLVTLLQKNISEILDNEALKKEIKENHLYKQFLFNQIMTKKMEILSTDDLTKISDLLNLNETQEAILIEKYNLNSDDILDENKKNRIKKIITSHAYKNKLINQANYEKLSKQLFLKKNNLTELDIKNMNESLNTIEKFTNEKNMENNPRFRNIAILQLFNYKITNNHSNNAKKKYNTLLQEKIKEISEEYNKIMKKLKENLNLSNQEILFIDEINNLKNFDTMLSDLTEEDLASTLFHEDLEIKQAIAILVALIHKDRNKARNVVKLMQEINHHSFQILYTALDTDSKINLTKEND